MTLRIAAWSGPRNLSTALMRSFEARGGCHVVDEPLYAAYLARTGKEHPGREEILASQPVDVSVALQQLAEPRHGLALQYEKHMAHHWDASLPAESLDGARHVLLIRDPARVVASYARVREAPLPEDLGVQQQLWWRDRIEGRGERPIIIDGDEILEDPASALSMLCSALGIPYTERMLSWPPGLRPTDGVWAPHWYGAVAASTSFSPPPRGEPVVPEALRWVEDALRPGYESLAAARLRVRPEREPRGG